MAPAPLPCSPGPARRPRSDLGVRARHQAQQQCAILDVRATADGGRATATMEFAPARLIRP